MMKFFCIATNTGAYHREDERIEEEKDDRCEAEWFFQYYTELGYRVQIIQGQDVTTEIEDELTTTPVPEGVEGCDCHECRNARKG